jgi:predicted helicase
MNKAKIFYHDIGDYLTREQKLEIVKRFRSIGNITWQQLTPNEHGDWISQRNDAFSNFIPLEPQKKFDAKTQSFFLANIVGVATGRDAWVLNFSKQNLVENMQRMIDFYNDQNKAFARAKHASPDLKVEDFIDTNGTKISWTRALRKDVKNNIQHSFKNHELKKCLYRPFTREWLYYDRAFMESPGLWSKIFPTEKHKNLVICCMNVGSSKDFSAIISDCISEYQLIFANQSFPLYYYEEDKTPQANLFDTANENKYIRRDAVSDFILKRAKEQYGKNVTKEDIFYYVYGFLHCPKYRETFANDLKKMLPCLPLIENVRDFWAFSKAGRALADLHLNYEIVPHFSGIIEMHHPLTITDALKQANKKELEYVDYRVEQMRFPKGQKAKDKPAAIHYNSRITLENIPSEAYDYLVNGKSAIEWIMERYAITTHKESGITNDPNDWAKEHDKPRYILDLLHSVINVSVQTVKIVKGLPEVDFEK